MKKIIAVIALGAAWGLAFPVFAQETKQSSKPSEKEGSNLTAAAEHPIFTPAELKWGDGPPGLPAGVKLAVLEGDPTKKGPFTIRLQAPAGYKIPPHTHPTAERITVISGTFHLGMGNKFDEGTGHEMVAGSFAVMPIGMKHFAWAADEVVLQVSSTGPFQIKYVNPADDPRHAKK